MANRQTCFPITFVLFSLFVVTDTCLAQRVRINESDKSSVETAVLGGKTRHATADSAEKDTAVWLHPELGSQFHVVLPAKMLPFPEPLSSNHAHPGFRWRGTKGWNWTPQQYLAEIPVLAHYHMNFLMNCYLSLHYGSDYKWWKPLPETLRTGFEKVVRSCQKHGITFCFSINPNLGSSRPLNYHSEKDFADLWQHFAWMQSLGVEWFNISLDDISVGVDAASQAKLVNRIFTMLRKRDPHAQMIFCPTHFSGTGTDPDGRVDPYLVTLAKELNPEIYVFWTGPKVCSQFITKEEAEAYRSVVKHRLFLWDNYPVNDSHPTMHLGPLIGRDPELDQVVDGYMSNPMSQQDEMNRIPLLTCADYAWNPWAYNPARSIGQAILHIARSKRQRETLRELVELYPGFLIAGAKGYGPPTNAAISRFARVLALQNSRALADAYLVYFKSVLSRMTREFPHRYAAARHTMEENLHTMKELYDKQYGQVPPG